MRALGKLNARLRVWPRKGWLVGGAVRDLWLGQKPKDLDFAVPDPRAEAERLRQMLGGHVFELKDGLVRLVTDAGAIDFSPLPPTGLAADLLRRDYTVNALAMNQRGVVFGIGPARSDLASKTLRAVRRENLEADDLRSLRGIRLWVTHGLRPEPRTWGWIQAHAGGLRFRRRPAWERVRDELTAILMHPRAAFGLEALRKSGLLAVYLPELAASVGVAQYGHHHLDVWGHTLEALAYLVWRFPESDLSLRLAVLLHDVAKPLVRQWDERRGYYRFFFHDEVGAKVAQGITRRLRFSRQVEQRVIQLVRRHMRLPPAAGGPALRRWVFQHQALLPDLLKLQCADRAATRGLRANPDEPHCLQALIGVVTELKTAQRSQRPLLTGHDVMALLGLKPGPLVGAALAALREAQALGTVHSQEEAKVFIQSWYEAQAARARHPTHP